MKTYVDGSISMCDLHTTDDEKCLERTYYLLTTYVCFVRTIEKIHIHIFLKINKNFIILFFKKKKKRTRNGEKKHLKRQKNTK